MTSAYGLMYGCFEHSNKTSLRKLISWSGILILEEAIRKMT
jgi:hypothetical protein